MQPPHPLLLVSDIVPLKGLYRNSVVCSFVPGCHISKVYSWSISDMKQPLKRSAYLKKDSSALAGVARLVGAPSSTPKGGGFDPQFWKQPINVSLSQPLSLSLPLLPFSKINNKKKIHQLFIFYGNRRQGISIHVCIYACL